MDVVLHALPGGLRRALDIVADLAQLVISLALIMLAWPVLAMLAEFDQRSQAADIPLVIPQALVPIGLGLTALLVGARLLDRLGSKRRRLDAQETSHIA